MHLLFAFKQIFQEQINMLVYIRKLNLLMKDNYRDNYERVLEVSIQLDNVINKYCTLVKGD